MFRERKARNDYLRILALRSLELEDKFNDGRALSNTEPIDFAIRFDSYRHAWGEETRENPNLRGSDYAEGEVLSQQKQLDLGYIPGFESSIKKLNELSIYSN